MLGFSTDGYLSPLVPHYLQCVYSETSLPFENHFYTEQHNTNNKIMTVINNVVSIFLYICGRKYKSLSDWKVCFDI